MKIVEIVERANRIHADEPYRLLMSLTPN